MWWAKYRQGGRIVRTSTGCTTKRAARDWLDVRAGKVASGERVPVKLDQILYDELHRDLLTRYQTVKKIRNLRDQKHRMERVLAHFGGWRAINVTATEIVKYVAKRQTEISPSTDQTPSAGLLNRELTTLKTVLRHGRDNGKLTQVPKIELLKEADPRAGVVEQADSDAIAQHLAEDARLAATIGFEVAWRVKSEVLTLTWDRVDLAEGCIRLDESHSKNGKSRRVYLSPVTTAMLVAQRGRMEALQQKVGRILPEVFNHVERGPWYGGPMRGFDRAWKVACEKAVYPGILRPSPVGRAGAGSVRDA